jgi:hypothetical protein
LSPYKQPAPTFSIFFILVGVVNPEIAWAYELQIFFEVFCGQTAGTVFHPMIFLTIENPFQQSIDFAFIGIDLEFVPDDKPFDSF